MKERLETSIGGFKVDWAIRFGLADDGGAEELMLKLTPDLGHADNLWSPVSTATDLETLLVRAGVPADEARSLSPDLWAGRWSVEDRRHSAEEQHEFRRVRSELEEQWGSRLTGLSPFHLVREWIAFVAIVEVGYDESWEYYGSELMTRTYIAELCGRLRGRWVTYFTEAVAPWDGRFRAATTENAEPFFPPGDWGEGAWWCYRWPRLWPSDHH